MTPKTPQDHKPRIRKPKSPGKLRLLEVLVQPVVPPVVVSAENWPGFAAANTTVAAQGFRVEATFALDNGKTLTPVPPTVATIPAEEWPDYHRRFAREVRTWQKALDEGLPVGREVVRPDRAVRAKINKKRQAEKPTRPDKD